MDELHKVLHALPGHLKAVVLELMKGPISRREVEAYVYKNIFERIVDAIRSEVPLATWHEDAGTFVSWISLLCDKRLVVTNFLREFARHKGEIHDQDKQLIGCPPR